MNLVVISLILLGLTLLCYRAHPAVFFYIGGGFSILSAFVVWISATWLLLIYPVTFIIWGLFRIQNWKWWKFSGTLIAATATVWVIAFIEFLPQWHEVQALARDYPVQRIDKRLAYEKAHPPIAANYETSQVDKETLRLATQIYESHGEWQFYADRRSHSLATLESTHNDFVEAFANQEGFGAGRIQSWPARDKYIRLPESKALTLPPPPRISVSAMAGEQSRWMPADNIREPTRDWHASSVASFSNADGFGHVFEWSDESGTASVARGFQPHAFQTIPENSPWGQEWQLAKLDLVSLLKHNPPAVYLSDSLPRMDELSSENFPTRELDEFEKPALHQLREGEVIVVQRMQNRVRMFGALLATHECVRCHHVSRGDMLGAFTYEFLRKEPLPSKKEQEDSVPPLT